MELVYLWVEDYKNIQKQGFNFSPRFSCEYDDVKNELTIKENDDYIENFFGDNINVTAIVGKNGSGKSSVLEALIYLIDSPSSMKDKNNFLMIKHNHHWYILTHSSLQFNIILNNTSQKYYLINRKDGSINCLLSIFINCITDLTHSMGYGQLGDAFEDYKNGIQPKNVKSYKQSEVEKENFVIKFLDLLVDKNDFFDFLDKNLIFDSFNFSIPIRIDILYDKSNSCDFLENLNSKIFKLNDNIIKFIFLLRIILSNTFNLLKNELENYIDNFIREIDNISKEINLNKLTYLEYKKICEVIINYLESDKPKSFIAMYPNKVSFIKNLIKYNESDINDFIIKFKFDKWKQNFYTEDFKITKNILDDKNELFKLLFEKNYIKIDFLRNREVSYQKLSSGEKHYIRHFTNIAYSIKSFNAYSEPMYLMLMDEIELSFHPNWQRKIVHSLKILTKKLNTNHKKINFVLTSHSPFFLSDIPKQNIIFLDKDEKGNCKVVDGLKEKKQTFGANIHTLLSDSFFMEDGLMGEFAKGKIDEVIKLLNKEKLDEKELKYCEQIISIIGEPIVKNQLQRMLDSKRLKKVDKIDAIEKDIKALQEALAKLKK